MKNERDADSYSSGCEANSEQQWLSFDRIVARKSIIGLSGWWLGFPAYFLFRILFFGRAKAISHNFLAFDFFIYAGLILAASIFVLLHFFGEKDAHGKYIFASNRIWVNVTLIALLDLMLFSFSWCISFTIDLIFL